MTETELRELIAAIDQNVRDLMADGKLAAAKYSAGDGGPATDRASGLKALLEARAHYQKLLDALVAPPPGSDSAGDAADGDSDRWELSQYVAH